MKITSLEIERFGLWSGLTLPQLTDGINVFYGANEAGKSTILEFIRSVLYGFGSDRQRFVRKPLAAADGSAAVRLVHASPLVISGGVLQMESPSGQYTLRRMFIPDRTGNEDQINIQTEDGSKQGSQFLRVLVAGVDEQTFNNVFAIGLDELQKLASLNDTEAAEMLFRLSVGIDRVSIVDTIRELSARRNKILNIAETESKPSQLTQLLHQREKIVTEIAETKLLVRQYIQIRNELRIVDRTAAGYEEDCHKLQKEKILYEIAKNAEPIWIRRDQIRDEIAAMGTVAAVSEEAVKQLTGIENELAERKAAYEKVKTEFQKAKKTAAELPVSEKIVKLAPRIEILLEEEPRIIELDQEIITLEKEVEKYNSQIAAEETQIRKGHYPLPKTDISAAELEPSDSVLSGSAARYHGSAEMIQSGVLEEYRTYAKAVNRSKKMLSKMQDRFTDLQHKAKELNERMKAESAKRGTPNLTEALTKATDMVQQLRRRQSIGQQMNEMLLRHKELRRINTFLLQNQALPGWMIGLIVLAGLAGAACIGLGCIKIDALDPKLSPVMIVLGCVMIGSSIAFKKFSEKNNAKKLEENQRQLGFLSSQIEQAKQEVAAVDTRFPAAGSATIEMRLQEAQQEQATLEKLIPADAQRTETNRRLKLAETRLQEAKEQNTSAVKHWNDWLRRTGLPHDWTPARIKDYIDHCDVLGDLRKEIEKRSDLLRQRIKDIKMLTNRIDHLVSEINLNVPDGESYVQIFARIRKRLEENNAAVQKRTKFIAGIKAFRRMRRKVESDLDKAKDKEKDILRKFGVKTPEELQTLHRRYLQYRRLLTQEQGIQRELDAAIGNFCTEKMIGNLLEPRIARRLLEQKAEAEQIRQMNAEEKVELPDNSFAEELAALEPLPPLDDLLKETVKRIEAASARLHGELQMRGQLTEQLKQMTEDRTPVLKQRELAVINEKIRSAIYDWQVYAVCARMLDEIRTAYERDRQPRTLSEASELLKQLTDEKYHRIWTPLGEETLLVDDKNGHTFDVSWLSRGTREQLFIALRLALASEFARHGSILPIILDDVLVNFDSRRAWTAIQVLLDVVRQGQGRQILLFTCHKHVCRMFQKMDIPVRILPPVEEPSQPIRVLLPRSVLEKRQRRRLRKRERKAVQEREQRIAEELAAREEQIRLDAVRQAEVQRLVLQMQQQATAEKAVEAEQQNHKR
ncbi:MAG: AAA family ATPase [Planctomycetaceae bacterium]|jgi:uncharacterized protein YhaN|nr:AAA family ATPase [Planctomycetaceae bacterium]